MPCSYVCYVTNPHLSHPWLGAKCGDVWSTDVGVSLGCVHVDKKTHKRMFCAFSHQHCMLMAEASTCKCLNKERLPPCVQSSVHKKLPRQYLAGQVRPNTVDVTAITLQKSEEWTMTVMFCVVILPIHICCFFDMDYILHTGEHALLCDHFVYFSNFAVYSS